MLSTKKVPKCEQARNPHAVVGLSVYIHSASKPPTGSREKSALSAHVRTSSTPSSSSPRRPPRRYPPTPLCCEQALLQEMCIPMKKPQLKELMKEIDTDGSGEIDFDEV